jgi:hypothetical protein
MRSTLHDSASRVLGMIHEFLTNALLAVGIIVGGTTLLDIFLGPATKTLIADMTITVWSYLDDLRRIKFISILRTDEAVFRLSYACAGINVYSYRKIPDLLPDGMSAVFYVFLSIASFSFIFIFTRSAAEFMIPILLKPKSGFTILFSSLLMLIIGGITWIFLSAFTMNAINRSVIYHFDEMFPHYEETVTTKILFVIGVIISMLSSIIGIVGMCVVVPVIVASALSIIVFICEFLIRRLAESPKGPMLAIGGVCGAVGSILKLFA